MKGFSSAANQGRWRLVTVELGDLGVASVGEVRARSRRAGFCGRGGASPTEHRNDRHDWEVQVAREAAHRSWLSQ